MKVSWHATILVLQYVGSSSGKTVVVSIGPEEFN